MLQRPRIALLACILGVLSFVNLLGIEKGAIAIIAGAWALKEIDEKQLPGSRLAWAGIILGILYIVVAAVIAAIKGPQLIAMLGHMGGK